MDFATFKSIMAAWGLVGVVCSAGMYLRALVQARRMAVSRVSARSRG